MIALPRWLAVLLAFASTAVSAAPQFPPLTGRVVDEAGLLSPQFKAEIGKQLAAHEQATSSQVVVVTLKTLGGYDIADYGYQLGRHWGIGQKGKNNGILLIVAPAERKMRIEVGYGLEGALTDAISRDIIERRIKPAFRQQNFEQGIRDGVTAILAALGGEYQVATPPPAAGGGNGDIGFLMYLLPLVPILAGFGRMRVRRSAPAARVVFAGIFGAVAGVSAWIIAQLLAVALVVGVVVFVFALITSGMAGGRGGNWGSSGGGWSSGGDGGGFSGGGGSFGGGGASGDW